MINIENICISYNHEHDALKNISLKLGEREAVGVIGANGSGKSTLFLAMMGLLKPKTGKIYFKGHPLGYSKKELMSYRQEVGMVFQNPEQQIFYSIVEEDVAFALRNLNFEEDEIQRRLDEVFDILEIQHLRKQPIQYLSYGQKKRVAIASVLVLKTKWVLLDEPTAGLDPAGKKQMITVIKKLIQQGKKVVLSSHDMDLMYEICNYFYILSQGEIVAEGDKRQVFRDAALLKKAKLEQPWLVKIHQQLNIPLFENEEAFNLYQAK